MASVEELLARAEEREAETQRLVTVHKELEFDLGNLLALDRNPVAARAVQGAQREPSLRALARDNTQLLVAQLWGLPAERAEGGAGPVVAHLPEPSCRLPREKPLPRARPPTRWEQFARLKGIRRRKRTGLVWDAEAKTWRRRWGYGRAGGDPSRRGWMVEVPARADPSEDQFARLRKEKRERVARNELNRLRNLARAQRLPAPGLHPTGHQNRAELGRAAAVARASTASVGRFQPRLPKEAPARPPRGAKRRFQPLLGDLAAEKQRQLELVRGLSSKKPPLDLGRAVSKQLRQEETEAAGAKGKGGKKRGQRGKRGRRQQQQQHRPGAGKSSGAGGARRGKQKRPAGGGAAGKRKRS